MTDEFQGPFIPTAQANRDRFRKAAATGAAAILGLGLLAADLAVSRAWIDRHFLPDFSMSGAGRIAREVLARGVIAFAGAGLLMLARRLSKIQFRARSWLAASGRIGLAALLALGASEVLLRTAFADIFNELRADRRPARQYDPRLGWTHVPGLAQTDTVAGRTIDYAMDAAGNRVAAPTTATDPAAPTLLIAGESVAMGYRLPWAETLAAEVTRLSGMQTADLAVEGYSSAQAYLRLSDQITRFSHPAAVVTVFLPSVFRKVIDPARPGLDASLQWMPPAHPLRLAIVVHWLLPYESSAEVARGVTIARAILHASDDLAAARGAAHLVLVPQFLPESAGERMVRERVLDGVPYILVPLQPDWRVPDGHPDARGDHAMAMAVVSALRQSGVLMPNEGLPR